MIRPLIGYQNGAHDDKPLVAERVRSLRNERYPRQLSRQLPVYPMTEGECGRVMFGDSQRACGDVGVVILNSGRVPIEPSHRSTDGCTSSKRMD